MSVYQNVQVRARGCSFVVVVSLGVSVVASDMLEEEEAGEVEEEAIEVLLSVGEIDNEDIASESEEADAVAVIVGEDVGDDEAFGCSGFKDMMR
jgi:hypothetical protein